MPSYQSSGDFPNRLMPPSCPWGIRRPSENVPIGTNAALVPVGHTCLFSRCGNSAPCRPRARGAYTKGNEKNGNHSLNMNADGMLSRLKRDHPDTESLCGSAGATGGWPHNTKPNRPLGGRERLTEVSHTPHKHATGTATTGPKATSRNGPGAPHPNDEPHHSPAPQYPTPTASNS